MDQNEYTLPGIMNYLQNEFIQIEKMKINNNLEISEMKFKISKLESATNSLNSINNKLVYENENLKKDNLGLLNIIKELKCKIAELQKSKEQQQQQKENEKTSNSGTQNRDEENLKKLIDSNKGVEGESKSSTNNDDGNNRSANGGIDSKSSASIDEELRTIIEHLSINKSQTSLIKDLNLSTVNNNSTTSSNIDLTPLITSRKFLQDCMKEMFYLIKNDQNQHQQQQQHSTINIFEKYNYLRDLKHFEMMNTQNNNANNNTNNVDSLNGGNQKLNFDNHENQQQNQHQVQQGDNDYTLLLRTPELIDSDQSNNYQQNESGSSKIKEAPQIKPKQQQQQIDASSIASDLDDYYDTDLETIINEDPKSTPDPLMIHEKMDLLENDSIMDSPVKTKEPKGKKIQGDIIMDEGSEYQIDEVVIDLQQLNKDEKKVVDSNFQVDSPFSNETKAVQFALNNNHKDILYVNANDKQLKRAELLSTNSANTEFEFKEIKESLREKSFKSVRWLNESTFIVYREPTKISIYKDYNKVHSIDLFADLKAQLKKLKNEKRKANKGKASDEEEEDDDDDTDLLPLRDNTILSVDNFADKLLINCSKFYYIYDINTFKLIGFKSLTNIPLSLKFGKFLNNDDIFFIFNNNLIEMYNSKEDSEFVLLDNTKITSNIDNIIELNSSSFLIRAPISSNETSYYKFGISENKITKKFTFKDKNINKLSGNGDSNADIIVFKGHYLLQLVKAGMVVVDLSGGAVYKEFVYYGSDVEENSKGDLLFSWLDKEKGVFVLIGTEGVKGYCI